MVRRRSDAVFNENEFFDDPNLAFTHAHAVPPPIFNVSFSEDKSTLIFILRAAGVVSVTRGFRVYFASISLASPNVISRGFGAYNVFQQSDLIASVSAPSNGNEARQLDNVHATLDGWFFATAVNLNNVESDFSGPQRNPIVGTNDSRVPPDVTDQTATLTDGGLDPWGRQLIKVTVAATIPQQTQGVSIITVGDAGAGYTSAPTVAITGGGGSGAEAYATVQNGAVAFVTVTKSGLNYTTIPDVVFTGGGFSTVATAVASLTSTGSFDGYQIYFQNYFSEGIVVEGPHITNGSTVPGLTLRGDFPLLQDTPPAHPVVLYFVALSQTGTRVDDPTTEPSVTFAGGIEL